MVARNFMSLKLEWTMSLTCSTPRIYQRFYVQQHGWHNYCSSSGGPSSKSSRKQVTSGWETDSVLCWSYRGCRVLLLINVAQMIEELTGPKSQSQKEIYSNLSLNHLNSVTVFVNIKISRLVTLWLKEWLVSANCLVSLKQKKKTQTKLSNNTGDSFPSLFYTACTIMYAQACSPPAYLLTDRSVTLLSY